MPAVEDHGDVDVDDVAVLQPLSPGMPWQTTWLIEVQIDFGIAAIAERRRHRLVVEDEVVAELVELAGRDAGLDVGGDEVERLGGQPAGPAHAFKAFRRRAA